MARRTFVVTTNISEEVRKAVRDISNYDEKTQARLREVIREETGAIYDNAVAAVPKKTGRLAAAIKQEFYDNDRGLIGLVKAMSTNAHLQEFGAAGAVVIPYRKKALHPGAEGWFAARAVVPRRLPHPFLKPAADKVRPELEAKVKEAITND